MRMVLYRVKPRQMFEGTTKNANTQEKRTIFSKMIDVLSICSGFSHHNKNLFEGTTKKCKHTRIVPNLNGFSIPNSSLNITKSTLFSITIFFVTIFSAKVLHFSDTCNKKPQKVDFSAIFLFLSYRP